jgi:hypothetical protein
VIEMKEMKEFTVVVSIGTKGSLAQVDGVPVIAREPALTVPVGGGAPVTVKTVDRVILENEAEVFQCVWPDADCYLAFATVKSATAHQRTHSPKKVARQALAKQRTQRVNRSAGSTRGSENRVARRTEVEQLGLPDALRREAGILEERASWLRAMAATADKWGKTVTVSPEELATLREDAQQWRQLRGMLGK